MPLVALFFSVLLLIPCASAELIYKCKNPQGQLLYQGKPCEKEVTAVTSWGTATGAPLVIPQGHNGHYFVDGRINNHSLNFIIDTGATIVSLPQAFATSAGLRCQRQTTLKTGNGTVSACVTVIQKLQFGNFVLTDVEGVIASNLDQPLLGMNVLKKFRVEQDHGEMRLSQRD